MNIILALSLVVILRADSVYNDEAVFNCKPENDENNEQKLQELRLFPIDCWVFLLISPITFVQSARIVYHFLANPRFFGIPGDIIFVITITNGVQSIVQFATAIYVLVNDKAPDGNVFCYITGIATSIVFVISNMNIFVFAAYPLALIYNAFESTTKFVRIFNYIVTLLIIVAVCIGFGVQNSIVSLTLNGMCAISASNSKLWDIIISLIYLLVFLMFAIMSVAFIFTFKKLVPKISGIRQLRGQYLRYYQRFISFSIIMKLLLGIFSAINLLNCYFFLEGWLTVSETCQNVTQALCILGQVYIITYDPIMSSKFHHTATFPVTERSNTTQEMSLHDFNVLDELHKQMKKTQVQSMLAGIQMLKKQKHDEIIQYKDLAINDENDGSSNSSQGDLSELVESCLQPFTLEEVEECQVVQLNEKIKEQLNISKDTDIFKMRCILYAPKIFNYFISLDNIDLEDCFDLVKNQAKLDQQTGPDGGKSGEFFFFSYDNQLIIKTMRQSEVCTYKKRLYNFATYLANKPQSLLTKIYGMYTFERQEEQNSKVHFLIMRNISLGIPRSSILRTFDMKGSEYDREVLAKKQESDLSKMTLKDLDFFKIEQQMWVEPETLKKLRLHLTEDSEFLEKQKLIDYSLLVMVIDWNGKQEILTKHLNGSSLNIVASLKEPGVYYHIAIIDYLQQWNVNKNVEQTTKKLINMNMQLDTSAQKPQIYGKRFVEKLINRILPN